MKKEREEFHLLYEHGDPVRAQMVKALLDDAGIDCYIKNADVQNLFGMGSIGGINPLLGTVKVFVRREDRVLAESALAGSQSGFPLHPEMMSESGPGEESAATEPSGKGFLSRLRQWLLGA